MDQDTQPGRVIGGRYRLVSRLGTGGLAPIWLARDEQLGLDVEVHELRLPDGHTQDRREASNVHHPNLVPAAVVVDDGTWIVMSRVQGITLDRRLAENGPLTVEETAEVATALLRALDALHEAGILHRDVKPANVMMSDTGEVLLSDSGIARAWADTVVEPGTFVGTPEFMAPELVNGQRATAASDLFALGVTLYQAVEGVSPFRRATPAETIFAISYSEPPRPWRAGRLTSLITQLLWKEPDKRPTIAHALVMLGASRSTKPAAHAGGLRLATTRTMDDRQVSIAHALRALDSMFPVSIYLSDEAAHREVEAAVEDLLDARGAYVISRDKPVLGSWFRKLHAGMRDGEVVRTAAHALDSKLVHAQDAANTATLMQSLAPVLASLQSVREAVIRVGALLIVKADDSVAVHQLTATQQLRLDHQPDLLTSPREILGSLHLTANVPAPPPSADR